MDASACHTHCCLNVMLAASCTRCTVQHMKMIVVVNTSNTNIILTDTDAISGAPTVGKRKKTRKYNYLFWSRIKKISQSFLSHVAPGGVGFFILIIC